MILGRAKGMAVIAAVGLTVAGCGGGSSSSSSSSPSVTLSLVAYSTPQAAYESIIKAFQATDAGKNVKFTTSFGASGDQSRAVDSGLPADIVAFSLAPDIERLVKDNIVDSGWAGDQYKGMITDSVVVIATRKGNPKGLSDWSDLTKSGVDVITPNPFTSGGARWNIMAAYGAESKAGADKDTGVAYLNSLFKNVSVQDDSARKALATFTGGKGDALLSYENDAIFAQKSGQDIDYTIPDDTILIENPVAVTKTTKHATQAKAFLDYLHTTAAQQIFVDNGYRSVVKSVEDKADFPTPSGLFTIDDLGGWDQVTTDFFDPTNGIMVSVEKSVGVSVSN